MKLSELSDQELRQEVTRRRRARAKGGAPPSARKSSPKRKQVEQWYANLELHTAATLGEVKRAYDRLMRRYDPNKHRGDSERHKAASELAASLTAAYHGLTEFLEPTD